MDLSVDVETGRLAFVESVEGFVRAVDGFSEWELLGPSRCHGWTRLDVVGHVIGGWQEMLGGLVSVVDADSSGLQQVGVEAHGPNLEGGQASATRSAYSWLHRSSTPSGRISTRSGSSA